MSGSTRGQLSNRIKKVATQRPRRRIERRMSCRNVEVDLQVDSQVSSLDSIIWEISVGNCLMRSTPGW